MATAIANLAEMRTNCHAVLGPLSVDWERYFRYLYLHSPFFRDFWQQHSYMWSGKVDAVFLTLVPGLDHETSARRAVQEA